MWHFRGVKPQYHWSYYGVFNLSVQSRSEITREAARKTVKELKRTDLEKHKPLVKIFILNSQTAFIPAETQLHD